MSAAALRPRRVRARKPVFAPQRPILVMLHDAPNADGLPRAGLLHPGSRLPVVFPSLPAALAALNREGIR